MTAEEIFKKLKKLISAELGVVEAEISEESHLQEDLNADPLSIADLIIKLEKEFGITINQEQSPKLQTVGDILNLIEDQIG
ncbi:MAG: acyl carrier protein [bacterium]|nr:acyl carrier protein [bacterium]